MKLHTDFKFNGISFTSEEKLLSHTHKKYKEIYVFLKEWFLETSEIIVQTSGSTGTPKKIALKKQSMLHSAKTTQSFFNLPAKTTALLCLSPSYIAGKMMLVRAIFFGWHLDVVKVTSSPLANTTKSYDFSAMVPMQVAQSLKELHRIKKILIGGAKISSELHKKLQKIPTHIFASYGMTETSTHIAISKVNKGSASFYKTLPNVFVSKDTRGCLVINAPKISEEKITTNDLVTLISDTEFELLGRYDTIINSGGVKIIPEQVEAKLSAILQQRFFITSISDTLLGEKVVLVIEGVSGKKDTTLQKIKQLKNLAKYEFPKELFFIEKFVETASGKIDRLKTAVRLRKEILKK